MLQQHTEKPHLYHQPRRRDLVFHLFKTIRLARILLWDRRVSRLRKGAFLGGMGILLALLLVPEMIADGATLLSPLFLLLGVELPAEGAIDWLAFTLASFSLLKVFPKEILGEHYERLFHRQAGDRRTPRQHQRGRNSCPGGWSLTDNHPQNAPVPPTQLVVELGKGSAKQEASARAS